MATIKEIAYKYAERIYYSKNKQEEATKVANEINNLTNESNKPLSIEEKQDIVNNIRFYLQINLTGKVEFSTDNKEYLALVSHMMALLSNGKK
jgi:hypothetical protein